MSTRPNILVLMSDDHAAWAAGCYGHGELHTPNLDALARSGCLAEHAYTPNPVCSPARACFFTGRLPSQHGIHDWLLERPAEPKAWLKDETNLAEILRDHGYRTGLVGKWHCGDSSLPQPGFDFWLSYAHGQYPHEGRIDLSRNGQPEHHDGHQAQYLTDQAIEFCAQSDERPFFLFVGLVDTHSPFVGHPEEWVARYRSGTLDDLPRETATTPGWVKFGDPTDETRRREWAAQYYAAVSMIDRQVGRLMEALRCRDQLNDTLVIYTSDHGHMNGHHGLYTKGNATVPQNFYDEAIRVPLLLRHPATIPAGSRLSGPVDHCDLFQTVCAYADTVPPAGRNYPGTSFLALLSHPTAPWRTSQYCEYGNARMVRTAEWKLIVRYAPHAEPYGDELYDLTADPRETRNLRDDSEHAATFARLRADLEAHFGRYEIACHSGRQILSLPPQNPGEPWRLSQPEFCPPEGTAWRVLDNYPHS